MGFYEGSGGIYTGPAPSLMGLQKIKTCQAVFISQWPGTAGDKTFVGVYGGSAPWESMGVPWVSMGASKKCTLLKQLACPSGPAP